MRKRLLITGGTGLLAVNWALALRNRASVILAMHKRQLSLSWVHTCKIDLESVSELATSLAQLSPDLVVHTAAVTNVDRCETDPELAFYINVTLTENLAKACAMIGVRLVHISTDHIFDGRKSLVDENESPSPVNVYGRTKALAEEKVLNASPNSLIVRTNFYGWGTNYRQSFSDYIISALRLGEETRLFHDVFYTPILVDILAIAVHELVDLSAHGIYNIVGDERLTKYEFGKTLSNEFLMNSDLIVPVCMASQIEMVQRPLDMSLSNRKACALLGRRLGSTERHLERLRKQEFTPPVQEIRAL